MIGFVCTSILHLCNSDVTPLRSSWLIRSVGNEKMRLVLTAGKVDSFGEAI
jgi:hypothetical protein